LACATVCSARWLDLVQELSEAGGRKISLVGWSLGGLYARQLTKMMPDACARCITLGSPFAATPRRPTPGASMRWRAVAARDEDDGRFGGSAGGHAAGADHRDLSRTDGICAWRAAWKRAPRSLKASRSKQPLRHGLILLPFTRWPIVWRNPKANGRPFDRSGWRSLVYPDPAR